MKLGISIVICTYNGAKLLRETLWHIAQQRVRDTILWELILVDNASTDSTVNVIVEEWDSSKSTAQFSLLQQPIPGLTFARELALERAQYEYVLFCDDDNWLNPDYISLAYDIMQANSSIGVLGGHGELVYDEDPPAWAAALPLFANGRQAKLSGKVPRNIVYGAGCVIRKSAYVSILKAGFQPLLSDRVGTSLSSGGDYEMCYALVLAGYDVWYDERLTFKHFMPKARINESYYLRFFKESSHSYEVLAPYQILAKFGIISVYSFNYKLFLLFLSHVKKFVSLLSKQIRQAPDSEAAKVTTMRLVAVKLRLRSYRKYRIMKNNYLKLVRFKQENLSCLVNPFTQPESFENSLK